MQRQTSLERLRSWNDAAKAVLLLATLLVGCHSAEQQSPPELRVNPPPAADAAVGNTLTGELCGASSADPNSGVCYGLVPKAAVFFRCKSEEPVQNGEQTVWVKSEHVVVQLTDHPDLCRKETAGGKTAIANQTDWTAFTFQSPTTGPQRATYALHKTDASGAVLTLAPPGGASPWEVEGTLALDQLDFVTGVASGSIDTPRMRGTFKARYCPGMNDVWDCP